MKSSCKVFGKHFSGTKTDGMIGNTKLFLRDDPDHFLLHVGTNDLKSEKTRECIAESIIDSAFL